MPAIALPLCYRFLPLSFSFPLLFPFPPPAKSCFVLPRHSSFFPLRYAAALPRSADLPHLAEYLNILQGICLLPPASHPPVYLNQRKRMMLFSSCRFACLISLFAPGGRSFFSRLRPI